MKVFTSNVQQSILTDTQTTRAPQASVRESQIKTSPTHSEAGYTNSQHSYLNDIQPEQAREFLLSHVNRALKDSTSSHIDAGSEYPQPLDNESTLEAQLTYSITQAALRSQQQPIELRARLATAFGEVTDTLKRTDSLPESLENEFTRLQHSLSDFIVRLNELARKRLSAEQDSSSSSAYHKDETETQNA